jgi:hypothetical protein
MELPGCGVVMHRVVCCRQHMSFLHHVSRGYVAARVASTLLLAGRGPQARV